jgi:hypothetical protein
MTQVDHALTLVGKFDRYLRIIKNLGCHTLPAHGGGAAVARRHPRPDLWPDGWAEFRAR